MYLRRLGLLAFVLIGLCSTNERRLARANEPTPAGGAVDQASSAAQRLTNDASTAKNTWDVLQEALASGLKGKAGPAPVEAREPARPVKTAVKSKIATVRPSSQSLPVSRAVFANVGEIIGLDTLKLGGLGQYAVREPVKVVVWDVNPPENYIELENGKLVLSAGIVEGVSYRLFAAYIDLEGNLKSAVKVVAVGKPGPPPIVTTDSDGDGVVDALDKCPNTPPGTKVDANGCPVVIPPKPVVGKLGVVLIWESEDAVPPMGRLITALRTGTSAKYLIDKGHTLSILDDDSVGPDGQPSKALEAWRPYFAGMKFPALILMDQATKTLVHKAEIPATATADNVIELIRQHGG